MIIILEGRVGLEPTKNSFAESYLVHFGIRPYLFGAGNGIRTRTYSLASYNTTLILFQHGAYGRRRTDINRLTRTGHYVMLHTHGADAGN